MMFKLRRQDSAWEVVARRSVEPVLMYGLEEKENLDIVKIENKDLHRTYVFDVRRPELHTVAQNAITFARQQLLLEISKMGYNTLLLEGWKLAIYQREKIHRIEVQYIGRAARVLGEVDKLTKPPFMDEVLHDWL